MKDNDYRIPLASVCMDMHSDLPYYCNALNLLNTKELSSSILVIHLIHPSDHRIQRQFHITHITVTSGVIHF